MLPIRVVRRTRVTKNVRRDLETAELEAVDCLAYHRLVRRQGQAAEEKAPREAGPHKKGHNSRHELPAFRSDDQGVVLLARLGPACSGAWGKHQSASLVLLETLSGAITSGLRIARSAPGRK